MKTRFRRCDPCIAKHRKCERDPRIDSQENPRCFRCARLKLHCTTTIRPSVPRPRRETGSRIELVRALFGGEPTGRKSLSQKGKSNNPFEGDSLEGRKSGSPMSELSTSSQNTHPTSAENEIRRFGLTGKIRIELLDCAIRDIIVLTQKNPFLTFGIFRPDPRSPANDIAEGLLEFFRKFHWFGMNPKARELGWLGEIQTNAYALFGVYNKITFGFSAGSEELSSKYGEPLLKGDSLAEFNLAANTPINREVSLKYQSFGQSRQALLVSLLKEGAKLVERDLLDSNDWIQMDEDARCDLALSVVFMVHNMINCWHPNLNVDMEPIWRANVLQFYNLIGLSHFRELFCNRPKVRTTIERILRTDAVKASFDGNVPDLPDNLILKLMNIVDQPSFAKVTLAIEQPNQIPIPTNKREQVSLLWCTIVACDRMFGTCAASIKRTGGSHALEALENLYMALMIRDQWSQDWCPPPRRSGETCMRCDVPMQVCSRGCFEEEVSIKAHERCTFIGKVCRLLSMVEDFGSRNNLARPDAVSENAARWWRLRISVRDLVYSLIWEAVQRIVEPDMNQNSDDPSRNVMGLGTNMLGAFENLPGGIGYLITDDSDDLNVVAYRRGLLQKLQRALVHKSCHAGFTVLYLTVLDRAIENAKPSPSLSGIFATDPTSDHNPSSEASTSLASPHLQQPFPVTDFGTEETSLPSNLENELESELVDWIVEEALRDMTCPAPDPSFEQGTSSNFSSGLS